MDTNDDECLTKTSSSVLNTHDLVIVRDFLNDTNCYFSKCLESDKPIEHDHIKQLYEQSTQAMHIFNEKLNLLLLANEDEIEVKLRNDPVIELSEQEENASYLDMSMRKYESCDLSKTKTLSNRHEYVDVVAKSSAQRDDDNIYDDFMVEGSKRSFIFMNRSSISKPDCPFRGLPAAHLTIMQSPKIGWLTMHRRRHPLIQKVSSGKKKYYSGVIVEKQTFAIEENHFHKWWLLMYTGTNDLKPTICLPLYHFEIIYDPMRKSMPETTKSDRNLCKFELKSKSTKKDSKTFCVTAESPDHCQQWFNILTNLINGKPYVDDLNAATAQIRKLPLLPLKVKSGTDQDENIDTVDTRQSENVRSIGSDGIHHSEAIYEDPEVYYKNVRPKLSIKTSTPHSSFRSRKSNETTSELIDISLIYDIPKPNSVRATIASETINANDTQNSDSEKSDLKKTSEIKNVSEKKSTTIEQSTKHISLNSEKIDEKFSKNLTSTNCRFSSVRKWLHTNHLAKIRNSTRRKSNENKTDTESHIQSNQLYNSSATISSDECQQKRQQLFAVQPKGNKVHMIINQLEANGQLTLINGGASSNKFTSLVKST